MCLLDLYHEYIVLGRPYYDQLFRLNNENNEHGFYSMLPFIRVSLNVDKMGLAVIETLFSSSLDEKLYFS